MDTLQFHDFHNIILLQNELIFLDHHYPNAYPFHDSSTYEQCNQISLIQILYLYYYIINLLTITKIRFGIKYFVTSRVNFLIGIFLYEL